MLSLPSPLRSGDLLTALVPWSQRIVDYLRAITVRSSPTVSVSTTANGTTLTAASPAASSASRSAITPWAFEATATPELDANDELTGLYTVNILGGTAQATGGPTAVFPSLAAENVADGEFFYIRFMLWDNNFAPTCYWYNDATGAACTIEHAQALPTSADNSRFVTLVICKLDSSYPGAIIQYRAGAIDIDATLAAGVAGSGITVRTIASS